MNRSFPNIEYRISTGQNYRVGYAPVSGVWHIRKCGNGYVVSCQTNRAPGLGTFTVDTLADVSSQLYSR